MNTFSIMCDHCEDMLEYSTQYGVVIFLNNHPHHCKGPTGVEPGPLEKAYKTYLGKIPKQLKDDLETENIKSLLRKTTDQ